MFFDFLYRRRANNALRQVGFPFSTVSRESRAHIWIKTQEMGLFPKEAACVLLLENEDLLPQHSVKTWVDKLTANGAVRPEVIVDSQKRRENGTLLSVPTSEECLPSGLTRLLGLLVLFIECSIERGLDKLSGRDPEKTST